MAEGGKFIECRQLKGNNSALTEDTPIKLHVLNLTMVIYIQFHEFPSIDYLVMAEDVKTDGQMNRKDGQCQTNVSLRLWRGIIIILGFSRFI